MSPAAAALARVVLFGIGYSLGSGLVLGPPWPTPRELARAALVLVACRVAHALAELLGGLAARLYLLQVAFGSGRLVRHWFPRGRAFTLARYPTGVEYAWSFTPGRSVRALRQLPALAPIAVVTAAWAWSLRAPALSIDQIEWILAVRGALTGYLVLLFVRWPNTPDVPSRTATMFWEGLFTEALLTKPLTRDPKVRRYVTAIAIASMLEDAAALRRLLVDPLVVTIPVASGFFRGQLAVLDGDWALSLAHLEPGPDTPDEPLSGDRLFYYLCGVLGVLEEGQSLTPQQERRAQELLARLPYEAWRSIVDGFRARLALLNGDPAAALKWARRSRRWSLTDRQEGEGLLTLAVAQARLGQPRETERALAQARRLRPDSHRWPIVQRQIEDAGPPA